MFSALKFLFSHSSKEMEIAKIVEMRMKTFDLVVNGNATEADRRAFRLNAEYEARREIGQRQMVELILLITAGIGAETLALHLFF